MPVAPTVKYGDQVIVESGAIIETILNRHAPGKLQPALDSPDYPYHLIWMHYAEGSLAARLFQSSPILELAHDVGGEDQQAVGVPQGAVELGEIFVAGEDVARVVAGLDAGGAHGEVDLDEGLARPL